MKPSVSRFEVVQHSGCHILERVLPKEAESIQEAWAITFDKWRTLKALQEDGKVVDDGGWETCGLCDLFFPGCYQSHVGCPIEVYGHAACVDTPYEDYSEWSTWSGNDNDNSASDEYEFLVEVYRSWKKTKKQS